MSTFYEKTVTKPLISPSGEHIATISGKFSTEIVPGKEAKTIAEAMLIATRAEEEYNRCTEELNIVIKEKCSDEFLACIRNTITPTGCTFSNSWEKWKTLSGRRVKNFVTRKHAEEVFLCAMKNSVAEEDARQQLLTFYLT